MKNIPELGDEAECKVTGFRGVITGTSQWLSGCDRVSIQAPIQKDGKYGESYWVDIGSVRVIKKGKVAVEEVRTKKPGGPSTRIT